jgi:hypothetical protein
MYKYIYLGDNVNKTFAGALGIDFNLENVNIQLQNDFDSSEQIVFIVDGTGEILIATNVKVYKHAYMYLYICMCIHVCVFICIFIYVYVC